MEPRTEPELAAPLLEACGGGGPPPRAAKPAKGAQGHLGDTAAPDVTRQLLEIEHEIVENGMDNWWFSSARDKARELPCRPDRESELLYRALASTFGSMDLPEVLLALKALREAEAPPPPLPLAQRLSLGVAGWPLLRDVKWPGDLPGLLLAMVLPEYLFSLALVPAGYFGWQRLAWVALAAFAAASLALQLGILAVVARFLLSDEFADARRQQLHKTSSRKELIVQWQLFTRAESWMSLPLPRWLRLERWALDAVSMIPNYLHVPQTALVCGQAFRTWTPTMQASFARHWLHAPGGWLGALIGDAGLPLVLACSLALCCACHGCFALLALRAGDLQELADAANLLFAGELFRTPVSRPSGGGSRIAKSSWARTYAALLVKFPLAWVKVSLLAVTFDGLTWWETVNLLLAIGFGTYSIAQVTLPVSAALCCAWEGIRRGGCRYIVLVLALLLAFQLPLFVLAVHMLGVFICPSHDLALMRLACTA